MRAYIYQNTHVSRSIMELYATMTRKQRSDSLTAIQAAASAADLSTVTAPREIFGVEHLTQKGLSIYDQLYRSRAEWAIGDLALIVQAAACGQLIHELRCSVPPGVTILTHPTTGTVKVHPALIEATNQQKVFAGLIRDAGLRQRDSRANDTKSPHAVDYQAPATTEAPSVSFDAWIETIQ